MGDSSKPFPVCGGDQRSITAPCGNPTNAKRFGAVPAAVCAHAVAAGVIASRSGSAMVAPTPLSTARREMCFCDRYIVGLLVGAGFSRPMGPPEGGPYFAANFAVWVAAG